MAKTAAQPIRIALDDWETGVIADYLALSALPKLAHIPYTIEVPDMITLYRFADYLGSDELCEALRPHIKAAADASQLLHLAADVNDDADFIRRALAVIADSFTGFEHHANMLRSIHHDLRTKLQTLPPRYHCELAVRLLRIHSNSEGYGADWRGWEWIKLPEEVDRFVASIRGEEYKEIVGTGRSKRKLPPGATLTRR